MDLTGSCNYMHYVTVYTDIYKFVQLFFYSVCEVDRICYTTYSVPKRKLEQTGLNRITPEFFKVACITAMVILLFIVSPTVQMYEFHIFHFQNVLHCKFCLLL